VPRIQIKGSEFPIARIFSREFVFRIPLYQRPYAWKEAHAEELFDDLLDWMGTGTEPIDDLKPYFLGGIVVIKEDSRPNADVVDGQQRLTTLAILLSAIRSRLTRETDEAAVRFARGLTEYIYERGDLILDTPDRYRLTLRPQDADFFRDYIQREDQIEGLLSHAGVLSDSRKNIKLNAAVLVNRLNQLTAGACIRLAQFVIRQCFLVVVSTPDFASAYRIFLVLNSRGLDLSHSDILKSEIIGEIPAAAQARYGELWEKKEDLLGRDAFANLFTYIRMIFMKIKAQKTLLEEFREHVMPLWTDRRRLVDEALVPFAEAYSDIKDANYQSAAGAVEINRLLKWLNRIDSIDWLPPAILYMKNRPNDPTALTRFFADLERLAAILMLIRAGINKRIERFGGVIAAIERNEDLYCADSPLQVTADENQNAITVIDGDVYGLLPRLYILLRLDSALAGGGATYEYKVITVEHVLPQNPAPGSQWETWWPDPQVRAQWVHRLGNLALLTRRMNAAAGNLEFEEKKTKYFTTNGVCPFALTTQVLNEREWTPGPAHEEC
jgi:Protein of unknown function DUF262/Protein of unknown function (DUF1524)